MVCKLASNKIHNTHKKSNQINYYIIPSVGSLVDLATKIAPEFLSLKDEAMCWKKTKWLKEQRADLFQFKRTRNLSGLIKYFLLLLVRNWKLWLRFCSV